MIDRNYLERIREQLIRLETRLSDPAVGANRHLFQTLMAEHAHLRALCGKAETFFTLQDEREQAESILEESDGDVELEAMAREELKRVDAMLPGAERALTLALIPPDPTDSRNTILEIRAGTGGDEAALFAADLFRMYHRFAERQGWTISIIDSSESSMGGFKEVVFLVEGKDVFRLLRYESGVHRVQRVPATEAQGRIHTSAATVAVLPEAEPIDDIDIPADDIRMDLFCASGPGGQKVNKTTSAVRLTHLPTGIVVQSQDERSQLRNKERAMQVLQARLLDRRRQEAAAAEAGERRSQVGSGDRSERIRTYNFPQNRLTDHRIGLTLYSLDRFVNGELDEVLQALRDHDMEERLLAETAG